MRVTIVANQDEPDIQALVDATPAGGRLQLAATTYTVPDGGLVIRKPIEIYGQSYTPDTAGATVIKPHAVNVSNQPCILIDTTTTTGDLLENIHLHDFVINFDGGTARWTGSDGIRVLSDFTRRIDGLRIERVRVSGATGDAIHLEAANPGDAAIVNALIDECILTGSYGMGVYAQNVTALHARGTNVVGNQLFGVYATVCGTSWIDCVFENNCLASVAIDTAPLYFSTGYGAQVKVISGNTTALQSRFVNCWFENFANSANHPVGRKALVVERSAGTHVYGCNFVGATSYFGESGEAGVFITDASDHSSVIGCRFYNVNNWVLVSAGQVGVAQFNNRVTSSSGSPSGFHHGLAVPWVSDSDIIAPGASGAGAMVWNTTRSRLEVWNGSAWVAVSG